MRIATTASTTKKPATIARLTSGLISDIPKKP
jgi:hypothetical protein